jgi:ABC-2 type transport system permease protein
VARTEQPSYIGVFLTFARNSLVRDMTFRSNFVIDVVTSIGWMMMNLAFYTLIFEYTPEIGHDSGWGKYQFFIFLATTIFVNSLVQAFFMPNADEFGELVRTGNLDFALLKPIDTQFLVSLRKIEWSSLGNFFFAFGLVIWSLYQLGYVPSVAKLVLYPLYLACGVAIMYSLMIALSATSIWLGQNRSLYDFWFYITNFARYPMEIYQGAWGTPLRAGFTFIIPILIVVNVPAQIIARPIAPDGTHVWPLALFALLATALSLFASRWVFQAALRHYRSASS